MLQNGFFHAIKAINNITNVGIEWIRNPKILCHNCALESKTSNEKIIIKNENRNVSTRGVQNSNVFMN